MLPNVSKIAIRRGFVLDDGFFVAMSPIIYNNMDNNFGFFNAKLYCEGALILVCVFVEL